MPTAAIILMLLQCISADRAVCAEAIEAARHNPETAVILAEAEIAYRDMQEGRL